MTATAGSQQTPNQHQLPDHSHLECSTPFTFHHTAHHPTPTPPPKTLNPPTPSTPVVPENPDDLSEEDLEQLQEQMDEDYEVRFSVWEAGWIQSGLRRLA